MHNLQHVCFSFESYEESLREIELFACWVNPKWINLTSNVDHNYCLHLIGFTRELATASKMHEKFPEHIERRCLADYKLT